MTRFYGEIQGNRGEATRMGNESSGFTSHIRGWDVGVRVRCIVGEDGEDEILVYCTGGSNNSSGFHIATVREDHITINAPTGEEEK